MDAQPHLGTGQDLELRAARIADPAVDLNTRFTVACELREMLDTVRESDSATVLPRMVPTILDLLRSGEVALSKDAREYHFRRVLIEILHRICSSDVVRPHAPMLFKGMLYLIQTDNEENGTTCCKILMDITRTFRPLTEELLKEFMAIFQTMVHNMKQQVETLLSDDSAVIDEKTLLPSVRSFKVLSEMCMVIIALAQVHRGMMLGPAQASLHLNFEVLELQSPTQRAARENFEAMGGLWAGMAPNMRNGHAYVDFVGAQIKMITYTLYALKGLGDTYDVRGETLILAALRVMQDCPGNAIASRRDLVTVLRHLIGTTYRNALLSQLDKLFDEKVLLGTGVGSQETLRSNAYAALADFIHHVRGELNPAQLGRIAHIYSRLLHNPYLTSALHTLYAKMLFGLIETITAKDTPQGAAKVLGAMLETCVDKLDAMTAVQDELESAKKGGTEMAEISMIEKARPVAGAVYAIEKPEEAIHEYRLLFRALLHGFRAFLGALKKVDAPTTDGTVIFRLFEGSVRCMSLYEADQRESTEVMDWFAGALNEVNLHVFQEVWTHKIEFFFELAKKRPGLLSICQSLFMRELVSPTLVAIVLRFLIDRLPLLGEYDDATAVVTIRLFKMAFNAVQQFPHANEPILASHLAKLIMDCFPLAAKATKPTNYLHLLRGLFRAIGGGGGKFEMLYQEVLPLLPEMLESLNRQLLASEGYTRDMIVELCLTVPLRLTHLLPHLTYLMHPLALALRGGPELVSQGLRTLELCIDNLTPDFLDPTLSTILRELMEALHSHLKPLPANHHHAHTTIRILGKLGGRNRRLLTKEPSLNYSSYSVPSQVFFTSRSSIDKITLSPVALLASKTVRRASVPYRAPAYLFLVSSLSVLAHDDIRNRDEENVFVKTLEGVFDATLVVELRQEAEKFICDLARTVFTKEINRGPAPEGLRRQPSALLLSFLEAFPHALARDSAEEAKQAQELVSIIIQDLVAMAGRNGVTSQDIIFPLHQIASRFSALCLEESWVRKSAGCSGIRIMTCTPDLGVKWINDREVDLVRTLLHILKDLASDLPRDVEDVVDVLMRVLRVSNSDTAISDSSVQARNKLVLLVGIFCAELQSSNAVVRRAAQTCIELLTTVSGKSAHELLMPHRERMLQMIYAKPLRALPFPIQIGMIEAIRYYVSLDPPLPDLDPELLRLLHECLAAADADDGSLLGGRPNPRQGSLEVIKLRVACIKLLTASMPMTDFFSKHHNTRQRVTGVYFKSLYSLSPEVKEVAHEGLRSVLKHQNRLPRELLQTGLRPILMNLADPKRLSVPGLEGLARLLELLTHYFKVEIGHKLLDHFRTVADPQMLQQSSRLPLVDNEGITKLVRLANIFHLLPSAANIFLDDLVHAIVQTEARMHFSSQSPFSEPLAKFLDRYPSEAAEFFMNNLQLPRYVRTLRSILHAKLAPNLERELVSRTSKIVSRCLQGNDRALLVPGLLLLGDFAEVVPTWIAEHGYVVDVLLDIWRAEAPAADGSAALAPEVIQRHTVIISIFKKALEQAPRIDLLFDLVAVYARQMAMDLVRLTHFLYRHIALNEDVMYQRNVLMRFLTWFDDRSYPWSHKTFFIRLVVTPTLLVHANRSGSMEGLLDAEFVRRINRTIWQPMAVDPAFGDADDMFKIELLHLTTVMVQYYSEKLAEFKKDIIRCAWHYITSEDAVVKQTAYLLAARFFEVYETPEKFILRAWTGLLRPPHTEGRLLIRQALDILAPALPRSNTTETGTPQWAKTTRRLLAEEGLAQIVTIYQLIVRQSQLFFPVRALFVPHMVNSLQKLGFSGTAAGESRVLSIDVSQIIFEWDQMATQAVEKAASQNQDTATIWTTPEGFRETVVSYLVRLATAPHEPNVRAILVRRALALLKRVFSVGGWPDVIVKVHYFSRALEQNELSTEALIGQALSAALVLQITAADKPDAWYHDNCVTVQRLIRKGLLTDEVDLHDALHPIFERLHGLYPLPKEEEEQQGEMGEFHRFIYTAIGDGLRNHTTLRSILLMLKSVVQVVPERIETFSVMLMRLLGKLAKDHVVHTMQSPTFESTVQLIIKVLEISEISIACLGDQRKTLLTLFVVLIEKSKSAALCNRMLEIARNWAIVKRDPYPNMKDKATMLKGMVTLETRAEPHFHTYLQLIYDIYTEPTLRRSDLTTRLEHAFLLGCRARDPNLREKFMDLLDASVPRSLFNRLSYILGVQSWEALADHNWIYLAVHLLLGSVEAESSLRSSNKAPFDALPSYTSGPQVARNFVQPIQRLLFLDPQAAHDTWITLFPTAWALLSRREQIDVTQFMITLLSKDYHIKQAEVRPNVIQTLLTGVLACSPPMTLPPHLLKYLAKTYDAWHVALELLEASMDTVRDDESSVRDAVYDSLADIYAELAEEDVFYGLWRRRCLHPETNCAIAFEQNGMWEHASNAYESAQAKSRSGAIPFSEPEFCLWEDHWMLSAEKLQSWEALYDLAKQEGNVELQLESAWRIKDWADNRDSIEEQIKLLPEIATPRRRVFEAFIALLKMPGAVEKNVDFTKLLEDAMQLSLRKWASLPSHLSAAHVPLLQHFQQFVELQEAVQIFGSLSATNAQNLEKKSSELKMVLQAWRERLPDLHDDISIWSDLVALRQNVFNAINKAYLPLINNNTTGGGAAASSANTYGYRGYHETAWIINRFAHVARKHDLLDVCFNSLNKIYTLPNIEISEAFLKLREQARCHYQKPNDLQAGLEVINNTNLMYFSISQKAEFYTLKGMFHARFERNEEANVAFGQAVQLDISQAKAWAEWGRFNDRMFKAAPTDMSLAAAAVSCYLQAAGSYKSGKSRAMLARVLWLISVDDGALTVSRAFDTYKGDGMFWYWITFIPQLLASVSQRESKQARYLLTHIGRLYPQALIFPLRTTREEMALMKKQAMASAAARSANTVQSSQAAQETTRDGDQIMRDGTGGDGSSGQSAENGEVAQGSKPNIKQNASPAIASSQPSTDAAPIPVKQPWDYIDEILSIMKTGHPLLVLTIETMVDQVLQRFKANGDDEVYRLVCMLLGEAVQNYAGRALLVDDNGELPTMTVTNLARMVGNLAPHVRKDYEEDFIKSKPNQFEYVQRLQAWRDKYEAHLNSRPRLQSLDLLSHYLIEFQYGKFDEIEVPGQYTEEKDTNQNFVRIQKFAPKFENCRTNGSCWKRFTIQGSDNSKTSFSVQQPSPRFFRREDKIMQVLRTFNTALTRKKESRKRRLTFHLPAAVSFSPTLRLIQTDTSYITLSDIYDQHCENAGITREDPVMMSGDKLRQVARDFRQSTGRQLEKTEISTAKKEIMDEIVAKLVPENIITRYFVRTMDGPSELWRMRKQFATQVATTAFITHMFCMTSRVPSRFSISRITGQMFMSDLLPGMHGSIPALVASDAVPFRFTPNMQHFVGPIFTEGIITSSIFAIGRCLTEPEFDLDQQLCLFVRDEIVHWLQLRNKSTSFDLAFRKHVASCIDSMVHKAELMACKIEREQAINNPLNPGDKPVVQTVTNLISQATNPGALTRMLDTYHPWF